MPPRLRSQPFGPDSPNAVQGLPDPPRRRRATRSASAQPQQEDKPSQPVREPKARKPRGKAASRGKKKAMRRTSPSPSPLAEPQLEGDETVSGAEATGEMQDPAPAIPSVEIPVTVLPSIEDSDPELTAPSHGVLRSTGTAPNRRLNRRHGASPSSTSEHSRVLRTQGASPIHRSRTSYANRSNSRRIESRGSFSRTLYRLPQLLSLHSQHELQNDSGEGTNSADEQDSLNLPPATAVPENPPPATPERISPATPVAPMTAPPAGNDVSPGWSRWIFNGVSRRWTVLRGRFAHNNENENENQLDTNADEPAVPTAPATLGSSAEAIPVAPASTAETIQAVSGPVVASTAPTSKLAFPPVDRAQTMTSLPCGPSPSSSPCRAPALRRPRRLTFSSFVDTRTLLSGNESTNIAEGHKAQHEFVKRRQAARLALEKEKREVKIREEKAAQRTAAAAAAARDAAHRREYHPSNPSPKSPVMVSGGMIAPSNTEDRSPLNTRALAGQLAAPDPSDQINGVSPLTPTSQIAHTTAKSNADAEKLNPRKRSRGFGLDEDDLAVHEDDFTPEEWEALKAEVEKAEEDAAKAAQENAPPTKKRRVDTTPKQQKRTRQSVRHQTTGTPRQTEAPSRTPGYIPNRRGTMAPPDLSPIDSSRLLTDPDSPLIPQTQATPSSQQGMTVNGAFVSEAWRRTGSPVSSPTLPTPPRPAMKRKQGFEAPDPDTSSSSPNLLSTPPRKVKRSQGYEALDPYAPSSSPSSASPRRSVPITRSLAPYDAASHFSSLRFPGASPEFKATVADCLNRCLAGAEAEPSAAIQAETEVEADNIEGSSPLTRARNKAEQFKPKTPSRLRESTRIPSSNASTPSALGISSPSFNDAIPVGTTGAFSTTAITNTTKSAVNEPERNLADDVAWLSETLPNGNFKDLKWPPRRSLVEVLDINPEAVTIVEKSWQEKGPDAVKYFEPLFQAYEADPDEFVLTL